MYGWLLKSPRIPRILMQRDEKTMFPTIYLQIFDANLSSSFYIAGELKPMQYVRQEV